MGVCDDLWVRMAHTHAPPRLHASVVDQTVCFSSQWTTRYCMLLLEAMNHQAGPFGFDVCVQIDPWFKPIHADIGASLSTAAARYCAVLLEVMDAHRLLPDSTVTAHLIISLRQMTKYIRSTKSIKEGKPIAILSSLWPTTQVMSNFSLKLVVRWVHLSIGNIWQFFFPQNSTDR